MKEHIVVQLPLSMTTALAIMRGVTDQYPHAVAITDHHYGTEVLVMEVDSDDRPN